MGKIDLGPIGAVVSPGDADTVETAVQLEQLGYSTIWLAGGPLDDLDQVVEVVQATRRVRVATGILSVDRFAADEVTALYAELEADHPGRFVIGLGGAHGPRPLDTLGRYLDRLDAAAVPRGVRLLAALGPRMLELAAQRTAGALPVLVTPEYTARARARVGDRAALAVEQLVVVEADPDRARAIARGPLRFLGRVPAYQDNFRRMGFTDDEIGRVGDRLVDALVPWGDAAAVAARIAAQVGAGADHVAISVTTAPGELALDRHRELVEHLVPA